MFSLRNQSGGRRTKAPTAQSTSGLRDRGSSSSTYKLVIAIKIWILIEFSNTPRQATSSSSSPSPALTVLISQPLPQVCALRARAREASYEPLVITKPCSNCRRLMTPSTGTCTPRQDTSPSLSPSPAPIVLVSRPLPQVCYQKTFVLHPSLVARYVHSEASYEPVAVTKPCSNCRRLMTPATCSKMRQL